MRRGQPLQRKTPLVNKKPLVAQKGLQAKSAPKGRRASTGPARDVVDAVGDRASHSCEVCGTPVGPVRGEDHHIHHRRPRAMGGTDRPETNWPSNLMLLCPEDHAAIESNRTGALAAGWLVPQHADPAQVAVVVYGPRRVYLDNTGGYALRPPLRRQEGEAS